MDTKFQAFEAVSGVFSVFAALFSRYVITPAAIQVCCLFAVQCEAKASVALVADAGSAVGGRVSDIGKTFIGFSKEHDGGFTPVVSQVTPSLTVEQVNRDASVSNGDKQGDARASDGYLFWCAHIFVWLVVLQSVCQSVVCWRLMFGNSYVANGSGNGAAAEKL